MYTDDRELWWELEHEFAGFMTTMNRGPDATPETEATEYLEEYYTWVLEYGRGLEQEDFIQLVLTYAPELLKIVEV